MSKHVVIIGAVATGPKAACRFKRLEPNSKVTMIDKGEAISYGGCGIPYYVSGDVADASSLQTTSFHAIRDASFFHDYKGVDVLTRTEALSINRAAKSVLIKDLPSGKESELSYDELVIATGSRPRRLPIPGMDLDGVFTVGSLEEAVAIKNMVAGGDAGKVVIIGGGFVGLEMAEALCDMWGLDVTVVEFCDQILPGLVSPHLANLAMHHMTEKGVNFHLSEQATAFEGNGKVERVVTNKRAIEADLVVVAVGVLPNTELAAKAGLEVAQNGALIVDEHMRTSDPNIYSGGDCVQVKNLVSGKPGYYPLGSLANRQGRVIGSNLAGREDRFEGVVGSFVVKLFERSAAAAGLTLAAAKRAGFDAVSTYVPQFGRAHFYPHNEFIHLEMTVEKNTRRVLGIQGFGDGELAVVCRVDAVAAILKYKPTIEDIANLELAYSPPFSSAMDIVNAIGNAAENQLEGLCRSVEADEFLKLWENRENGECAFIDCRAKKLADKISSVHPEHWISLPQNELAGRLGELPRDKQIILICNSGMRSYEAQRYLEAKGISNTKNLKGGIVALKHLGIEL